MARLPVRAGLLPAVWLVTTAAAHPQAVKLNAPLAQPASGDVLDYLVSPDGARVVYRSDELTDNAYELFSAPADGSGPTVRLNDPLAADANVGGAGINFFGAGQLDYAISTTGRAVFVVDQHTNNQDELYSAPLDGSASPVRLSGSNVVPYAGMSFLIVPGGTHVLYRSDEQGTGNLYRAPIDGSTSATLITPGLDAESVWISPDGATAVFTVAFGFSRQQLYSVPSDGSAAPTLLGTTQPPLNFGWTIVTDVEISDDGTHAVFHEVFDEDGPEEVHLIAVPLDASHSPWLIDREPMNPYDLPRVFDGAFRVAFIEGNELVAADLDGTHRATLSPAGWLPDGDLRLAAGGTLVVFDARSGASRAVFQAPLDGSQPALQLSSSGFAIGQIEIAGSTVVYSANQSLFAVPLLGGSPPVLVNPAPFTNLSTFQLHPGGQDVVFRSEGGLAGVSQLFTAPLDASSLPRRLSAPLIRSGDVDYRFTVAPDGAHVVYLADQENNETFELFGAPFAGGDVHTYSGPMALGPVLGDVESFLVTSDESRVVYRADQEGDEVRGLFVAHGDGHGAPRSLTTGLGEGCDVLAGYALDPAGTRVAFISAESPSSVTGWLYSSTLTQPGLPVPLDVQNGFPLWTQSLQVDSTGTRVFYLKWRAPNGVDGLRSVRLDGTGSPVSLNAPSGLVREFQLAPDGSAAFYLSDQDTAGVIELYRAPADGSAPSVRLNAALAGTADVSAFAVAPDGLHVVYVADPNVDEQLELFAAPSDGSGPALRISDPLVAGGDVREFLPTSDGASVVYRADALVDQTLELFRAPIAGGAVVRLTAFPSGNVNADFALSADGLQVLLRANPNGALRQELYQVPSDGSASPSALSGTLVAGGSVSAFALAPDQSRVVYLADERADNVMELFSVPLGGGPSLGLHVLPASADVTTFRIAADSSHVVFRADVQNEVFELFSTALDGSLTPRRLNRPLPAAGDVDTDFLPLGARRSVYMGEQEEDNVVELFATFPEHGPRQASTPTVTRTVGR